MAERRDAAVPARPRAPQVLPVDAVLFDLDGTLADTAPDLAAALNRVRRDRGLDALPLATLRPYASRGARGLLDVGMNMTPEHAEYLALRDRFLDYYESALCVESSWFDEVAALIAGIEARGLPWGIVTNKATRFTAPLLDLLHPRTRPGAVVCGDTTPHTKPHPAPLLHAAEALRVPPQRCVYVGDTEHDIAAGIAAGMRTIIATYGYIEPGELPDAWPADGSIDTPGQLLPWLPPRRGVAV